jgi:S1-C subfamily serine protease
MLYLFGEGVPEDNPEAQRSEAFGWFVRASAQGHASAQWQVGFFHEHGWVVPKDEAEAAKWYQAAAQKDHRDAQHALATLYRQGRGVAKNPVRAARWYLEAARNGHVEAQFRIGNLYRDGEGVKQNDFAAAEWYRKAADQGHEAAQNNLGVMYEEGLGGLLQDFVLAHMWYNLAARSGDKKVINNRDEIGRRLTPSQLALAQQLAREWKPLSERSSSQSPPRPDRLVARPPSGQLQLETTGSGFVVSKRGHLLTNAHVVEGCRETRAIGSTGGGPIPTAVLARDANNDLALLHLAAPAADSATFRASPSLRQGDSVLAVGFPLRGLVASSINVTAGTVSALAGPGDDSRYLQITAPIQLGNSGGPLLDSSGNVVGVVVGKLDAVKVAGATGDIPQNVNFAIQGSVARTFLEAHGIVAEVASSTKSSNPSDVADGARRFTFSVECWK